MNQLTSGAQFFSSVKENGVWGHGRLRQWILKFFSSKILLGITILFSWNIKLRYEYSNFKVIKSPILSCYTYKTLKGHTVKNHFILI